MQATVFKKFDREYIPSSFPLMNEFTTQIEKSVNPKA
jgi:hypothetical protein